MLRDGLGNALTPDIHSVEISVENGVLLDSDDNAHTSMKFDIFDSMTTFRVRAENDHPVTVRVKVDDAHETEMILSVFTRINIVMAEPQEAEAGGIPRSLALEVEAYDVMGNRVEDFDSLVHIALPHTLGTLSNGGMVRIQNGKVDPIIWTPGTLAAGELVRVQVLGVGERKVAFAVTPAEAAYPDHAFEEVIGTDSTVLKFFFRDRFGNVSGWPQKWRVWYQYNNEERVEIRLGHTESYYQPPHSKNGVHLIEVEEKEGENGVTQEKASMPPPGKYAVRQAK